MSTDIQGTDQFPETFPIPDDAINDIDAASVDVPFQSIADRTWYLFLRTLTAIVLNWRSAKSNANNLKRGVFSMLEQAWYAVGDGGADFLERSLDAGYTYNNLSAGAGVLPAGGWGVADVAARANGDLVLLLEGTKHVYVGTFAGYGSLDNGANWTETANVIAFLPNDGRITWDDAPANQKYVAVYSRGGANGLRAESWDGLAPTFTPAATLPANWSGYLGNNKPELGVKVGGGRVLASFFDDSAGTHKLRVMRTTDDTNWTDTTITPSFSPTDASFISRPIHNKRRDHWYQAISATVGGPVTDVWFSSDGGATWTLSVTLSLLGSLVHSIACIDDFVVAVLDDGREIYSVASIGGPVVWRLAQKSYQTSAVTFAVRDGGGGFAFWNSGDKTAFHTPRAGNVGAVVT